MPTDRPTGFLPRNLIILLVFLAASVPLFSQDRVEWVAVEGADHYEVEIRKDGELVLETRTDNSWIPLFLPAGNYEFQVRVMNSFGRTSSSSEWAPLRITAPAVPFVIALSPSEIHEGTTTEFSARVSGFVTGEGEEGSMFRLVADGEKDIELEVTGSEEGDGWAEVHLSTGRKAPALGSWNLVMNNPDGKESRMDTALEVLDNLKPRIRNVSPDEIPAGRSHNPLSIKITGLEEGAEISFHGPSRIQAAVIPGIESDSLEYSLNLTGAEPGWYSVSITNPSGGNDIREKAFQVLPRPLTEEEIAAQNALKIDDKEPLPLDEYPRALFFGWSICFPVGETADFYNPDYVGLTFGYSQNFHNDFFRKVYWLKGLSWDFTLSYTNHQTAYPIIDVDLHRYHFLLGLTYASPFNFPVNFVLRASSGLGISYYTSPDADQDEDLGGFTLRELGSMDYVLKMGGGMRITVSRRWFIDVVCDVSATFYLSRTAWSVQPKIEGGWRL